MQGFCPKNIISKAIDSSWACNRAMFLSLTRTAQVSNEIMGLLRKSGSGKDSGGLRSGIRCIIVDRLFAEERTQRSSDILFKPICLTDFITAGDHPDWLHHYMPPVIALPSLPRDPEDLCVIDRERDHIRNTVAFLPGKRPAPLQDTDLIVVRPIS